MRILLLGEYSNVHNTLAKGLRELGHDVTVASNGDFWKNYPRDIDLAHELTTRGTMTFLWRLVKALPKMRGYDIVQLINPMFLQLKAERIFPIYDYLRKKNKKIVLGAFGMDYYWLHVNDTQMPMRYSDSNIGDKIRSNAYIEEMRKDWINTEKQSLNEYIARDCDGIVAGLYEYWITYKGAENGKFADKMQFLPFPVEPPSADCQFLPTTDKLRIFIGISKQRHAYKGTDIMLKAAEDVKAKYPGKVELKIANGIPFEEYQCLMDTSDCILDQLYAYTPAMNALLAMSKGVVVVGGGEPENYEILGERELRPIINVQPTYESCYHELEQLVLHPEIINNLKQQSMEYVRRHHDYINVARQYLSFYNYLMQ